MERVNGGIEWEGLNERSEWVVERRDECMVE